MKHVVGTFILIGLVVGLIPPLPVQAQEHQVVLTHVLTGVSGAATQEFIALQNISNEYVDISDWCLFNKNNVAFACARGDSPEVGVVLPPGGVATFASTTFVVAWPDVVAGWEFEPTSASSGSLVGSNDMLEVRTPDGIVIDTHSWSSTLTNGFWFLRSTEDLSWQAVSIGEMPFDSTERYGMEIDYCSNLEGVQDSLPEGMVYDETGDCVPYVVPTVPALFVNELMINPKGSDTGLEWIELWNAGSEPISFEGIQVQLGVTGSKSFSLDGLIVLNPGEYYLITQPAYDFSLTNTIGMVRLVTAEGEHIFATEIYENAKDDQTWASFESGWQFTKIPTPGAPNETSPIVPVVATLAKEPTPCRADQYRNPETNRCRLLPRTATPSPCKPNQYRSPETNRCRTIAVAAIPKPCEAGQERNAETGRCRKIRELVTANYDVLGAQSESRPQQWYGLAVLVVMLLGLVGYAVWEWRQEISRFGRNLWARLAGGRK